MVEIVFRAAACADGVEIHRYSIAGYGADVADVAATYLAGLQQAIARLIDFPEISRTLPGSNPVIRTLAYRHHRVFYTSDGATAFIIRILHERRDAESRVS